MFEVKFLNTTFQISFSDRKKTIKPVTKQIFMIFTTNWYNFELARNIFRELIQLLIRISGAVQSID